MECRDRAPGTFPGTVQWSPKIELTQQAVVIVVSQQFHHGSEAVPTLERRRGLVLNSALALRL